MDLRLRTSRPDRAVAHEVGKVGRGERVDELHRERKPEIEQPQTQLPRPHQPGPHRAPPIERGVGDEPLPRHPPGAGLEEVAPHQEKELGGELGSKRGELGAVGEGLGEVVNAAGTEEEEEAVGGRGREGRGGVGWGRVRPG